MNAVPPRMSSGLSASSRSSSPFDLLGPRPERFKARVLSTHLSDTEL